MRLLPLHAVINTTHRLSQVSLIFTPSHVSES